MSDENNDVQSTPGGALSADETAELDSLNREMAEQHSPTADHYWRNEQKQARWRELDQRRHGAPAPVPVERDDGEDAPLDQNVVQATAAALGLSEHQVELGMVQANALDAMFGHNAAELNMVVEGLPDTLRREMARELSSVFVNDRLSRADTETVELFENTPHGALCMQRWGSDAPRRLAVALAREERFEASLSDADLQQYKYFWHNSLSPEQRAAILDKLTD